MGGADCLPAAPGVHAGHALHPLPAPWPLLLLGLLCPALLHTAC